MLEIKFYINEVNENDGTVQVKVLSDTETMTDMEQKVGITLLMLMEDYFGATDESFTSHTIQ